MTRTYGSLERDEYAHLTRILADFAAWLTPPWAAISDQDSYHDLAIRFLHDRNTSRIVDPPQAPEEACDLCGMPFSPSLGDAREAITGENYLWCPNCLTQQMHVYRLLGPNMYQAAWRDEQKAAAHDG